MHFDDLLAHLPALSHLLDQYGEMTLYDYAQKYYLGHITSHSRKDEFLTLLRSFTTKKFWSELAHTITSSLDANYCVSTAEHHGPHGHPFFWQSTLLRRIVSEVPPITFATSHVSLGNSSYPRGILLDTKEGRGQSAEDRKDYILLPLFPANERMSSVFWQPAYTDLDIEKHTFSALDRAFQQGYIDLHRMRQVRDILTDIFLNPHILAQSSYSDQITLINRALWWLLPDFFSSDSREVPISLNAEEIVLSLLEYHLNHQTDLSRLLTDLALQPHIEEAFNGIQCCFNRKNRSGTYLFWYLDEHHHRHALWREWAELVSADPSFRVQMNTEEYLYHLQNNHLIPSGLLVYSILSAYYGVTCFGWFSQGSYLPRIQRAFAEVLQKIGVTDISLTTADILCEDLNFLMSGDMWATLLWVLAQDIQAHDISQKTLRDCLEEMQGEIAKCL